MRKPTENNRHDSELSQRAGTVVYAHDLSGNITFLNHEGERLLGYSREEACGMNIAEVIDPSIADHIREQILRDAKERVGTVYEIDLIARDGRRIPLEVSTRAVLRDGVRFEVQGIAVPSVIRNQSSLSMGLRCLDEEFLYGSSLVHFVSQEDSLPSLSNLAESLSRRRVS